MVAPFIMPKEQKENFDRFNTDYEKAAKKRISRTPASTDETVSVVVPELVLDVETEKEKTPVGSAMSRKRRKPRPEALETKESQEKELPVLVASNKETPEIEIKEESAEEVQRGLPGASELQVSEVLRDMSEDADASPLKEMTLLRNRTAEDRTSRRNVDEEVASREAMEREEEKEASLNSNSHNVEAPNEEKKALYNYEVRNQNSQESKKKGDSEELENLRNRVSALKGETVEARGLYFHVKRQEEGGWKKVKKYFPFLKTTESSSGDMERRKGIWNEKLTEYKNAKIELVKREAAASGATGKEIGAVMAEAIRELDLRGSIENYNAWKDASWGNKKDSWFLRAMGRAKDWGESYRKLDWKKKILLSSAAVGLGVAGVAAGSVAAIGIGAAGGTLLRLLGSYGAGRGSYEFLEGYANKSLIQRKEEELSNVQEKEDVSFLEERMRDYAKKTQEDFERRIQSNRKRVMASVALGSLLFIGGTAFSLAHAASAAEHATDGRKVIGAVQQALDTKPAGLSGSVSEVVANPGSTAGTVVKGAVETAVQTPGTGGLTPDAVGTGVIDHDVAAEIVGKIGKNISETSIVPEGSSFERVLSERLTETGIPKEEAGKLVHRAMLDLAEKTGKPFEFFNHIRPGAEIQYEIGSDRSLHVFGVTRKAGGEVIKRVAESVSGETSSSAGVLRESTPFQPKSLDIPNASSPIKTLPLASSPEIPTATIESPQDIFERRLPNISVPSLEDTLKGNIPFEVPASEHVPPVVSTSGTPPLPVPEVVSSDQVVSSSGPPDAFDKYKGVAVAGAAIGAAASAVGGGALIKAEVSEMRARRKAQQEAMRKKEIEEEIEDTRKKNSDIEATQKRANEVIDQVLSIASFPDDRKKFLREVQDRYGVYGDTYPSEEAFRDTMGKIAGVLFGSEAVLQNEDILGNMFLTVAQRGVFSEKEKESLEELRRGIRNGYSVFQGLFLRTGERIPKEKVEGLRVGDVLRLFTERFLTGKMPEELRGSRSNG